MFPDFKNRFLDQTIYSYLKIKFSENFNQFKNHVDRILLYFDHPPTSVDIFDVLNVDRNGKFKTTYPPPIVYVVFE